MTLRCEQVRAHLAELSESELAGEGSGADAVAAGAISSAALDAHLCECAECHALMLALREVDDDLLALPAHDASDALVEATLARVTSADAQDEAAEREPETLGAGSLLLASMASMVLALGSLLWAPFAALLALTGRGGNTSDARTAAPDASSAPAAAPEPSTRRRLVWVMAPAFVIGLAVVAGGSLMLNGAVEEQLMVADTSVVGLDQGRYAEEVSGELQAARGGDGFADEDGRGDALGWSITDPSSVTLERSSRTRTTGGLDLGGELVLEDTDEWNRPPQDPGAVQQGIVAGATGTLEVNGLILAEDSRSPDDPNAPAGAGAPVDLRRQTVADGYLTGQAQAAPALPSAPPPPPPPPPMDLPPGAHRIDLAQLDDGEQERSEEEQDESFRRPAFETSVATAPSTGSFAQAGEGDLASDLGIEGRDEALRRGERTRALEVESAGARWWSDQSATEGLAFAPSDGWWANTYVPGDRAMRLLAQRLAATTARSLPGVSVDALALAELAAPTEPALTAPTDTALALGVHADVSALDSPRRVRLEVSLRSLERAAGRRSPLRVAVVVDARSALSAEQAARVRDILAALGSARSPRDRVALYGAGPGGGELVGLGTLAHGPVEVALRRFLPASGSSAAQVSLDEALIAASSAVAGDESVGLVLLLTASGAHDARVDGALHASTLAGVTTSAIGLSSDAALDALDAIALRGQGRRRVVAGRTDAVSAVRGELEAASRLVARAIRVRVRLAPGVRLVSVIGSRALDELESTRTREVERAIDVDMASRLGIESDREDDDDGIRILIPAFYAGSAHSMIFDLVVSGPGAVAEVDVRYKDLVRLDNGRASGALSLPRGTPHRGARELRVVAAVLGHEVASALGQASAQVSAGDLGGARARLQAARDSIAVLRAQYPELARVSTLSADTRLLDGYLAALHGSASPSLLSTSLEYAARRRVVLPISTLAAE